MRAEPPRTVFRVWRTGMDEGWIGDDRREVATRRALLPEASPTARDTPGLRVAGETTGARYVMRHGKLGTVSEVAHGLPSVLLRLVVDPGRWILQLEDALRPQHYVQVLAYEDSSLLAEVVSNEFLTGAERWTSTQSEQLLELGWAAPSPPGRPNYLEVRQDPTDILATADRISRTLLEVFGLSAGDLLNMRLFSSARRGETLAKGSGAPAASSHDRLRPETLDQLPRIDPQDRCQPDNRP